MPHCSSFCHSYNIHCDRSHSLIAFLCLPAAVFHNASFCLYIQPRSFWEQCSMRQKVCNHLYPKPLQVMVLRTVVRRYNMGVIPTRKSLALCDKLSVSSFCRRRLSVVLVRQKFAEHLNEAVTYVEQGHVRVGPETITNPAFLVTRNMEDFITWVDSSKIKRKILEYNDRLDDYDAMN
ncbi:alpha-L RNA-binding motif/Ribosomal protein S4 family protein isoform X2 [Wolffia australiana]